MRAARGLRARSGRARPLRRAGDRQPVENPWVDVGRAGHGWGIAEVAGNLGHRLRDRALPGGLAAAVVAVGRDRHRGQDRPVPGPKVLRGEVPARELLEVRVDLRRADVAPVTPLAVDEQLVAAPSALLQLSDEPVYVPVNHGLHVTHAALRPVVEDDDAARLEPDVPLLHRGEPVRAAVRGVVLSADPKEAAIQEPHSSRQHPPAVESAPPQVARGDRAHARQGPGEVQHLVELLLRAAFQPALVIAVLPTAGVVSSDRLQVAEGVGADPDVAPAGRHGERANSV